MRPTEIQPTALTPVKGKVAAIEHPRPADAVVNREDGIEVARHQLLISNEPPIDSERVEEIRKAIASGTYPLVPARIADAMIAASLLLRNPK